MADRIDKMIIRLESDERSAKRLISQIGQVRAAMYATAAAIKDTSIGAGRVERAFADYGKSAQAAGRRIDGLNDMMDQLRRETLDAAAAQDRLERSMRDVDVAAQKQARTLAATRAQQAMQETRGYRSVGESGAALAALASRVGLGSVGQGIYLGSDISRSMGALQRLPADLSVLADSLMNTGAATKGAVSALQQYVPGMSNAAAQTTVMVGSLAAMAGASVALFVAFKMAKDIIDDSKEAVEGYMDVSQRYAELIATGTTEEVRKAIQANEDRNKALEIERGLLQQFVDAAENTTGWEGALLDLNDALGLNLGGIEDAKNKLEELDGQIGNNVSLNEWLEGALRRGETAAADAAVAEEELAKKRREAAQESLALIDAQVQNEIARRRKLTTYTPEQVDSEIQSLESEIAAIKTAYDGLTEAVRDGTLTHQEAKEAADRYTDSIEALESEITYLETTVDAAAHRRQTAADAEKRLEQATSDAVKARDQAAAAEDKRATLLSTYASQTNEISRKRQIDDTREAEDFARKQAADRAKHNADLIALDRKHLEARAELVAKVAESSVGADKEQIDALRDFQKDEARATVRYWQDIRRINRDERLSVASAAARLDASAVWEAQQSAKQQREERTEQLELERKERAEDYKDRLDELAEQRDEKKRAAEQELRDLDDKHRQERQARIAAFNQQLAEEAADRRIRQQRLAQDRAYEDTLRQQQFNNELAAINSLIVAAEQLERQSRATILAGGANPVQTGGGGGGLSGTQQYYQQIAQSAATGRYVSWAGQRVRTDMYDPMQAAGMTASEWYDWKRTYGLQSGGIAMPGRDYLVGERGAEWVRFMQPAMVYPHGQRPSSAGGSTSNTVGDLTFNIYESGNPQRTAEVVTRYIEELMGVG